MRTLGSDWFRRVDVRTSLRLQVGPIPQPLWGRNLRQVLSKTEWSRLRQRLISERGLVCETCGKVESEPARIAAHEEWSYDTTRSPAVATLVGIKLSCRMCHNVEHIGRVSELSASGLVPHALDDAIAHFCRVNGVGLDVFEAHKDAAFREWRRLSALAWDVDLGAFA